MTGPKLHTALVEADINVAYHQLYEACNGDMQERYRADTVDPFKPFEHLWDVP